MKGWVSGGSLVIPWYCIVGVEEGGDLIWRGLIWDGGLGWRFLEGNNRNS